MAIAEAHKQQAIGLTKKRIGNTPHDPAEFEPGYPRWEYFAIEVDPTEIQVLRRFLNIECPVRELEVVGVFTVFDNQLEFSACWLIEQTEREQLDAVREFIEGFCCLQIFDVPVNNGEKRLIKVYAGEDEDEASSSCFRYSLDGELIEMEEDEFNRLWPPILLGPVPNPAPAPTPYSAIND